MVLGSGVAAVDVNGVKDKSDCIMMLRPNYSMLRYVSKKIRLPTGVKNTARIGCEHGWKNYDKSILREQSMRSAWQNN
jgi:hypothetical protein